MSETFEGYSDLVGSSGATENIAQASEVLDSMGCADLLSLLTVMSHVRAQKVKMREVLEGNRFHLPSEVSQRDFHTTEGIIMDQMPEVDFVETSPLQPFGINAVLAGTNEKNVVAALRRSEANADATTALFRLAFNSFVGSDDRSTPVRLASNTRTVRAQSFDAKTKFLPHFKVFAEVTVGQQGPKHSEEELKALARHLMSEVKIIDALSENPNYSIQNTKVTISNILFAQDLIERGLLDESQARRNTANPDYKAIEQAKLDIPSNIPFDVPDIASILGELGFSRGAKITEKFQAIVQEEFPDLLPRLELDLNRVGGIGYYKHLCYRISAITPRLVNLPLADGGTTNWAERSASNKRYYTTNSGIGTELICQHFMRRA